MIQKHLQSDKIFLVKIEKKQQFVRPVNGEEHFNEPGLSHGFVHFANPDTGERMGFCGVNHFDDYAIEVEVE